MKVPFPLSLKVSLLLLANLLLLAAVGGGLYVSQFGIGWSSLTRGALGDQLQGIVDSIQSDLQDEPRETWSEILVPRSQKYNADFFIFTNEGTQISGEEVRLPPAVRLELLRAEGNGDPHPNNPRPSRPPPPRREAIPENRRPPGIFPPPEEGKFVVRSQKPAAFWIGLRLPIPAPQDHHIPGTLLIRADSVWTLVGLVRIGPWLSIAAGVMALSLLFWLPLVRSITRCLKSLTGATERIAEGEFTTRIDLARRDELGHLGAFVALVAPREPRVEFREGGRDRGVQIVDVGLHRGTDRHGAVGELGDPMHALTLPQRPRRRHEHSRSPVSDGPVSSVLWLIKRASRR